MFTKRLLALYLDFISDRKENPLELSMNNVKHLQKLNTLKIMLLSFEIGYP